MSRLNIDAWTITSDPRFAVLAEMYPYSHDDGSGFVDRHHARAIMECAWLDCLTRQVYLLSEAQLRICLQQPVRRQSELIDALIHSELAEKKTHEAKVYLKGTKGRIEWLKERRKAGARGGKESGKTRREQSKQTRSSASSKAEAKSNPPALALAPAPAPAPAPAQALHRGGAADAAAVTQRVVDAFNLAFGRHLAPKGWEESVKKLLAKGYTEREMRLVICWAGETWSAELQKSISPKTLLKLQSSQGKGVFPEYLSQAREHLGEGAERQQAPSAGASP